MLLFILNTVSFISVAIVINKYQKACFKEWAIFIDNRVKYLTALTGIKPKL